MLSEIESLMALIPQICHIIRVHMDNSQPFKLIEVPTILYLCVCLIVSVLLELYRL